jgi:hypothetical protein
LRGAAELILEALKERAFQFAVLASHYWSQSHRFFLCSQVLGSQRCVPSQRISEGETEMPGVALELDDVDQVGSFSSVSASAEDEVVGDAS